MALTDNARLKLNIAAGDISVGDELLTKMADKTAAQTFTGTQTFTTVNTTNLDAGASGTAGTVDVFPATAAKGKLQITCANQTGDTIVTLTAAAMAAATTVTIPDPGAAASFVMTEGAQTVAGIKTFSSDVVMSAALDHNGTTVGFYGITPATRPTAYTQTYSTADKTHANATSADLVTTAVTQTSPFGFAGAAQGDNIATQFNALRVDVLDIKQLVNSVIDDLQLLGILQ